MEDETVVHNGGCHCKSVRWKVVAPSSVVVWDCNCSICYMRANTHFIVPAHKFELLGDSAEFLTTYTFGTHTAKHIFCKLCGITSFYYPRSNPDGVAVTFRCVDPGTMTKVEIRSFDGKNWEQSYNETGETVRHTGGCHCKSVRWKVIAPSSVVIWDCNCSICYMRGTSNFTVPADKFELLGDSAEFLTTYTFGTHTAKHTFCKICGVTSFYYPRSNPDGVAVTIRCVDNGTLTIHEIKNFDGKNWERSYHETGIASCSKVQK